MKLIPLGTPIRCGKCQVAQLVIAPGNPNAVINGKPIVTQEMVMSAMMAGCPKKGPCTSIMAVTGGLVPYMQVNQQIPVDENLEVVTIRGPIKCEMSIPDRVDAC